MERLALNAITEDQGKYGITLGSSTSAITGSFSGLIICSTNVVFASITSNSITNSTDIAAYTGLSIGTKLSFEFTSITLTSGRVILIKSGV